MTNKDIKGKLNKLINGLQNSILMGWIWTYWQHEDTGHICILPFWRNPGRRYYRANWRA